MKIIANFYAHQADYNRLNTPFSVDRHLGFIDFERFEEDGESFASGPGKFIITLRLTGYRSLMRQLL